MGMEDVEEEDCYSDLHRRWVKTTPQATQQLKDEVGDWRRGRWTADELKTLKRNVKAFKKAERIKDLGSFIFGNKTAEQKRFYRYIAKDIQRPLFAVYRKMLRVFDVSNHVGRWSRENEEKLLRLHSIHGNRWVTIGKAIGVSGRAAQDKYRSMAKRIKKGAWSEEEESKLISAIRQLSGDVPLSEDAPLPPDVTWSQVAELVESRNAPQCRSKWYFDLGWRNGGGLRAWDSRDDVRLIQLLSSQSATDEDEVEWAELSSDWDSARSPYHLRNKWACLRRSVPSYHKKTFQENLEYLVEFRLPALQKKTASDIIQDDSD